jgi:hypothetical protein
MYSKEESIKLKKEFWTTFGFFSQKKRFASGFDKKWISHNTGINCLNLKFDFEKKKALVGIEINTNSEKEEEKYYDRLLSLRTILNSSFDKEPFWEPDFELSSGKFVVKIYHSLENVNIHNKSCWGDVFKFFYDYMLLYEIFYIEYEDIIKRS